MSPAELAELKNKISDAESAYHSLQTGRQERAFTDQNGERVEWTVSKRSDLYTYILQLKAQLPCEDAAYTAWPTPMTPYF